MSDIVSRLRRHRLSRYAPPQDVVRRRLRWVWVLGGLWLMWMALVSDRSLYRIWRLDREDSRIRAEVGRVQREIDRLQRDVNDPQARLERAERELREKGGMAGKGEMIYRVRAGVPDSLKH
jgi:cell division protein FtsB